eukprot:3648439-Prymnesium_polylepis.1
MAKGELYSCSLYAPHPSVSRTVKPWCSSDSPRPTRRKPRWTAKCRFYKRVNYSRRNATPTSP